jgi:tetratricopeptide (TPR) repeat protein
MMEILRYVFWEAVKILGLIFLGLLSAKTVASLSMRRAWVKPTLYALILALAALGAWILGNDMAAEVYMWSSDSNLRDGDLAKGYSNALQAVTLRPANVHYWRTLVESKIRLEQLQSALDDEPAMRALGDGKLDEVDDYQFALCSFFLGKYDPVIATTQRLIRQNPSYAAPYVLQGLTYTAERNYPEAEQSFTTILQNFPTHQAAVEGLARAYYLSGDRKHALAVLDETTNYPFPADVRQRFEALKGFYGQ